MKRTTLLIAVLTAYAAVLGRAQADRLFGPKPFDPFEARPRTVEQLIVSRRFAEALPLATELHDAYPRESLVAYWLATINHHLGRSQAEAAAWNEYVRFSAAPAEACPAWPEAHARAGQVAEAQLAFDRCGELVRR